ncbi:MAG: hypothetical protein ACRDAM_04600 [Casimicrobium sp.]
MLAAYIAIFVWVLLAIACFAVVLRLSWGLRTNGQQSDEAGKRVRYLRNFFAIAFLILVFPFVPMMIDWVKQQRGEFANNRFNAAVEKGRYEDALETLRDDNDALFRRYLRWSEKAQPRPLIAKSKSAAALAYLVYGSNTKEDTELKVQILKRCKIPIEFNANLLYEILAKSEAHAVFLNWLDAPACDSATTSGAVASNVTHLRDALTLFAGQKNWPQKNDNQYDRIFSRAIEKYPELLNPYDGKDCLHEFEDCSLIGELFANGHRSILASVLSKDTYLGKDHAPPLVIAMLKNDLVSVKDLASKQWDTLEKYFAQLAQVSSHEALRAALSNLSPAQRAGIIENNEDVVRRVTALKDRDGKVGELTYLKVFLESTDTATEKFFRVEHRWMMNSDGEPNERDRSRLFEAREQLTRDLRRRGVKCETMARIFAKDNYPKFYVSAERGARIIREVGCA